MTLKDLKDVNFDLAVDFVDDEIDVSTYLELADLSDDIASAIVVTGIYENFIICKFTNYLRRMATFHPTKLKNYLNDNYDDDATREYLIKQLTKHKLGSNVGDITDDGGEAVYHFIKYDFEDFIETIQNN